MNNLRLQGKIVVVAYSGGPDATALTHRLKMSGAVVHPFYINYRKQHNHPKTLNDLRAANASAEILGIQKVETVRAPLGERSKGERNGFFVEVLSPIARELGSSHIGLGTIWDGTDDDLSVESLSLRGCEHNCEVVTWDSFGIHEKADQFLGVDTKTREALFQTTSCQRWWIWKTECGGCYSCKARHGAFLKAFGYDPTVYYKAVSSL
ncbi:MAG: hypothetical protein HYT93_00640 [Parcubacteria group bacterium]|nr:hypothetical protein [Parcubacteria group bacterium]